ncbi:MAG: T9SS type A sorting domain-containing protein [Bacteroidaceae bacterium]|nr:T9SS type A sorting domain-containing protein [Bacteroidaceae bacterium]
MKTKNILAALLLTISANAMADEEMYQYLTITYTGSVSNIYLPIVQRISFEDDYLKVTTTEGWEKFPLSLVEKITFTESPTAIEALPEQAENLTYKDGTLAIKGDGLLRIFSTNGALVSIANVKEGANVSLDKLPAGVYIVRMGDKTIKVRR